MKNIFGTKLSISFVKEMLATATLKKSSITFIGTIVSAIFGAIFYIIAARFLGPSGFGILTVSLTVMTLTSDIGDLGTNTGLVNFVSRYIKKKKYRAYRFLKIGLEVKVLVWMVVFIFGYLLSNPVAQFLFKKEELAGPIRFAFLGVLSNLLFSYIIYVLQAMQKFWSWSLIQAGTNLLRLLVFLAIFSLGYMSVNNTLVVYIFAPLIGFAIGLRIIGTKFLSVKNEMKVAGDFFKYNKWVAAFAILSAVGAKMDTLLSARLLDSAQVGIYSAANQMVKIVPQIVAAFGTVIGPKMAETENFKDFFLYFKKSQVLVLILTFLGVLTIPIGLFVIPYVFGDQYIDMGAVFVILFVAMLVFLISVPIHMSVFYYYSFPKLFFYISFFHLLLITVLGYILISKYGANGAALTVLCGQVFDFMVPAIYVYRRMSERRSQNDYLG
jgi:O-antigen/teichoic acid export membrane protein